MGKEYLNKILLHSIPNGCINQIYTQGFNYEITFKKVINIYKKMKTTKKSKKGWFQKIQLIGNIPIVIVSEVKTDKKSPSIHPTPRRVVVMEIAKQ